MWVWENWWGFRSKHNDDCAVKVISSSPSMLTSRTSWIHLFSCLLSLILGCSHHADVCSGVHFSLIRLYFVIWCKWKELKHHDWQLSPTCDWAGGCMHGNLIPWIWCAAATVKVLAPSDVTRARWQCLHTWCVDCTFVKLEEVVTRWPSFFYSLYYRHMKTCPVIPCSGRPCLSQGGADGGSSACSWEGQKPAENMCMVPASPAAFVEQRIALTNLKKIILIGCF